MMLIRQAESGGSGALYQFIDDTYAGFTITNGNHVKIKGNAYSLNSLSNLRMQVNNAPTWFTVPSGAECILKIRNMIGTCPTMFAMNFRQANAAISSAFLGTGNKTKIDDITKTVTTTEAENLSCFFIYFNNYSFIDMEFDVEFYVNNERWI